MFYFQKLVIPFFLNLPLKIIRTENISYLVLPLHSQDHCLPNDLQSTCTKNSPQTSRKHPARNRILHLISVQESEPWSLTGAYKCPESCAHSVKAPEATGFWKPALFSGSVHFLPACLDSYIHSWHFPSQAWPLASLIWKSCIFLSTLWSSSSGNRVTIQLVGTSKETQYVRTADDSSSQLSLHPPDVLYSYLRLLLR